MIQKDNDKVISDVWKTILGLYNSIKENTVPNSYLKSLDPTTDISLYSQLHLIIYLREIMLEKTNELIEHIEDSYKEILINRN